MPGEEITQDDKNTVNGDGRVLEFVIKSEVLIYVLTIIINTNTYVEP
jgi:hypothetical protein